jgi:tRNA dimethylallyltransferase
MSVDAVLIAGPTASGKSTAALALAERIGGALVNVDSMQVYREARILTARPGDADLTRVPHLLYGHVEAREHYTAARYQADADRALIDVRAQGRVPVFVGGTGLYFNALTEGLADIPSVPEAVRAAARARREVLGADAFFAELSARDPETASRLNAADTQRVLRAAEVMEATGRSLASWQEEKGTGPLAGLRLACFVLSPPRKELHRRIEARFDAMLAAGALEEAARLNGLDPRLPAAKILGLRELWAVGAGELDLEAAKTAAKTRTRHYAKRQVTWFRHRMTDWNWLESQDFGKILAGMLQYVA